MKEIGGYIELDTYKVKCSMTMASNSTVVEML